MRAGCLIAAALLLTLVLAGAADTAAGPALCLLTLVALGVVAFATLPRRRPALRRHLFRPLRKAAAVANETVITLVGNLTDDPELRYTPSGAAVAKFRIASTPRYLDRQSSEWRDGDPLFLACNIWRDAAEHVAESLKRGSRVIVQGRLRQRSYETKEGEKRTVYELEVDEIGPSLRYATATVKKITRTVEPGAATNRPAAPRGGSMEDPWSVPAKATASVGTAADDEPPF